MPIYEYTCTECQRGFERYLKTADEAVTCAACQSPKVEKRLSTFAVAKGSSSGGGGDIGPCGSPCAGGSCRFD
jgi:putative FmdB family regulatory protein